MVNMATIDNIWNTKKLVKDEDTGTFFFFRLTYIYGYEGTEWVCRAVAKTNLVQQDSLAFSMIIRYEDKQKNERKILIYCGRFSQLTDD